MFRPGENASTAKVRKSRRGNEN